ncbi:unnamed protein product [Darwinula stevensoni]|uniref:GH18 domain-containing protein n=1 Tax=Darwinula stevensoni TaxID=69355 RepID=A0A7R9FS47_9CRUS|nr:unnamed protein product [Darwinula stevensoni]CAG0902813.1 unnamed protein product [Darwinula stevensoni]
MAAAVNHQSRRIWHKLRFGTVCDTLELNDWTVGYDAIREVPFAHDGSSNFISHDDLQSITAKINLAKDQGLGGVMAWSVDQDDCKPLCYSSNFVPHGDPQMACDRDEAIEERLGREEQKLRTEMKRAPPAPSCPAVSAQLAIFAAGQLALLAASPFFRVFASRLENGSAFDPPRLPSAFDPPRLPIPFDPPRLPSAFDLPRLPYAVNDSDFLPAGTLTVFDFEIEIQPPAVDPLFGEASAYPPSSDEGGRPKRRKALPDLAPLQKASPSLTASLQKASPPLTAGDTMFFAGEAAFFLGSIFLLLLATQLYCERRAGPDRLEGGFVRNATT